MAQDEEIDPIAAMKAMLLANARQVEAAFPGCNVAIFVFLPGAAQEQTPQFNHAASGDKTDLLAVVAEFLRENQSS